MDVWYHDPGFKLDEPFCYINHSGLNHRTSHGSAVWSLWFTVKFCISHRNKLPNTASVFPTSLTAVPPFPANSSSIIWPSGTIASITEEPEPSSTSPWNSTLTSSPVISGTNPTLSLSPNSTLSASANATWTGTSQPADPATSTSGVFVPPWPVSNSTTLPRGTGTGTGTIPMTTGTAVPSGSTPTVPWPTFNSTTVSLTGTVSIPVITSSIIVGTGFSSPSRVFTWTNHTSGIPTSNSTGTGAITATGSVTATTHWPSVNTTLSSQQSAILSPSNGTILNTSTSNATPSITSGGFSTTDAPPFPTGNSSVVPFPTGFNTSSIWLSTVMSTLVIPATLPKNRGHRRSHSDRNLLYCQFYETITFLTTLPVSELLSPSEHNHYYLRDRHYGDIDIDFQHQLYRFPVASIPGHELYFPSVYLGQPNGGTITGLPNSTIEPPFPTRNGTSAAGPTGTAPPEGSGTVFFTTEPPETSSGLNATATTPPFPAGNVTCTIRRGSFDIDNHKSRPPHHANPYSLAVCNIDAAVPNFKRNHRAYCHRGWSSTWNCDSERALQPVAELNILVAAIFIVVVFASVPSYWAFNYSCHCHQLHRADGVFNTMPYVSSMPTCTSKWQNTTSTKPSTGATNRTSSNTATTLLTATTKASVSVEGDSTTMFEPDGPVVPTTTVSDFTLPSNKAYPWGGNGPLFRRPNTTASDSEEMPVRQPGGWWLRWKRHFDRSRSRAK
ncbi:hypothetical protein GCG54_00012415 [Colletotrichum gloeosporioides]|uniref:Uncharacterized protein n=1 Tax=Colletotrichum gloeosporioides TaxID=474922 RepID=A0A8H4CE21_COLGL|nr:uncharacterized protein GCG54_00012415 [Colletotrichum gloeosporioides]KAF3802169.1 hypothetical protein GCG54_00012415 [Colletotrichum gloeosporioides]